jgi:uncharacterized phage protein gp47/JayE
MPWQTPTLKQCREIVRDDVTSALSGAVLVANSVLRVVSDAMAAMAHLVLRYIDWLALQLMPDTAEREWLDRHGDLWLVNSDESVGRKAATYAQGVINLTGVAGTIIPKGTIFEGSSGGTAPVMTFQTMDDGLVLGGGFTPANIIAVDGGVNGNFQAGETLVTQIGVNGLDDTATVVNLAGGTDEETDDELRMRLLERIRQPPMGGDAEDYVQWVLEVPGVTRAWAAPLEMGVGTVTVRFMMDDLRASDNPSTNGFPSEDDITDVRTWLNTKRPVAVKDFFVAAPIPQPVDVTIYNLSDTSPSMIEKITESLNAMFKARARPASAVNGVALPAQTIYAAWVSEAILDVLDPNGHFNLSFPDYPMPYPGSIAVLGDITFA